MSGTTQADVLIARWTCEQDITIDMPVEVVWADGTPAGLQDYLDHRDDTHTWVPGKNGIELYMLPHIVVDVRYDRVKCAWVMDGVGLTSVALGVPEADASDDQIAAALHTHLVVYKARIRR